MLGVGIFDLVFDCDCDRDCDGEHAEHQPAALDWSGARSTIALTETGALVSPVQEASDQSQSQSQSKFRSKFLD